MANRSAGIFGLGSYLPERILSNKELETMVDTSDEWIKSRTGISERRVAAADQTTSDLALLAAQAALADAGMTPEELDLIIVGSASPDMIFPATACVLEEKLGIKGKPAFDIQAACSGFIYGLIIAQQFIASGMYNNVLVVGAEALTRMTDMTDRNTCILFGDGAGAAVLKPVPAGEGILSMVMGSDGGGADLLKIPAGGAALPASQETLDQRQHYMYMNGNEVFKFAVRIMGEAALQAMDKAGISKEQIDCIIPHQANMRIVDAAMRRLDLPMEKAYLNLHKYGNISAASIPVAMSEAYREGRFKAGDNLVLVGFGAGLTWGSVVMKWCKK